MGAAGLAPRRLALFLLRAVSMHIHLSFDEILRRLLLMGLPLLPMACDGGGLGINPDPGGPCPHIFEGDVVVPRPAVAAG